MSYLSNIRIAGAIDDPTKRQKIYTKPFLACSEFPVCVLEAVRGAEIGRHQDTRAYQETNDASVSQFRP